MLKMIFKKALIFSLPVLSMAAQSEQNKEFLADQCHELSRIVHSLAENQQKKECADKLYTASVQVKTAAILIIGESNDEAKKVLYHAITALQYAELLSCKRYIQIAHSKFEAQKIRTWL